MDRFFDLQRFTDSSTEDNPKLIIDDGGSYEAAAEQTDYVRVRANSVTVTTYDKTDSVTVQGSSNGTINVGTDDDFVHVQSGSSSITVDGGGGNDEINLADSSKISVSAGAGNDVINIENVTNATITSGDGTDTITVDSKSKNITITDFSKEDVLYLGIEPSFATYEKGVLNLDGIQIKLTGDPASMTKDELSSAYGKMVVKFGAGDSDSISLGDLLNNAPPVWTYAKNKTVATYNTAEGQGLATLSGVAKFAATAALKDKVTDIDGISVDNDNNFILANKILNKTNVVLTGHGYNLKLDSDVTTSEFEDNAAWGTIVKGAISYTTESSNNGYYIGDDGKKIKYLKAGAKTKAITLSNLSASATSEVTDAVEVELNGNVGTATITDYTIFALDKNKKRKATIDGEDVTFIFNDSESDLDIISGGNNDDHVVYNGTGTAISLAKGNDRATVGGSKNKVDLNAGNDYIQLSGSENSVTLGADNDAIDVVGGTSNAVDAGAGNDLFSVDATSAKVSDLKATLGAGNDTISVVCGYYDDTESENVYNFTTSTFDLGAGNDVVNIEYASDTTILSTGAATSKKGNTNGKVVNFSGVYGDITLGGDADEINVKDASNTSVAAGLGNDTLSVEKADYLKFDGGAGIDIAVLSDSTVSNSTILMGAGKDTVSVIGGTGVGNIIDAGADADFILVSDTAMTNSTITGGLGDDTVSVVSGADSAGNTYYYGYGSGNDTIYGFTKNDVLKIAASKDHISFTETDIAGDALIVNVGEGGVKGTVTLKLADWSADSDTVITQLKDTAELSADAISSQIDWTVSNGTATGKLNGTTVATISGLKVATSTLTNATKKKADLAAKNAELAKAISDNGDTILIGSDALDENKTAKLTTVIGKAADTGYLLGYADDVTSSTTTTGSWTVEDTDDYGVATAGQTQIGAGYKISDDGKEISYVDAGADDAPVISGLKTGLDGDDVKAGVTFVGTKLLLSSDILDATVASDTGVSVSTIGTKGTKYTLGFGTGVVESVEEQAGWVYQKDTDTTVTASLDSGGWNAGYYLDDDGAMRYRDEQEISTAVKVNGLKAGTNTDKYLSIKGKVITVDTSAFDTNEHTSITIDEEYANAGYTLTFTPNNTIKKATTTDAAWSVSAPKGSTSATATYNTVTVQKNGYKVSDDGQSIDYYSSDDGGNTLLTLTGLNTGITKAGLSTALSFDGTDTYTVTLTKAMLGKNSVTLEIGDGDDEGHDFELALAGDVDSPEEVEGQWSFSTVKVSKTANAAEAKFLSSGETEGFTIEADDPFTALYHEATGGQTVVSLGGLSAAVAGASYAYGAVLSIETDTSTIQTTLGDENLEVNAYVKIAGSIASVRATGISVNGKDSIFELTNYGKLINTGLGASLMGSEADSDTLVGGSGKDFLDAGEGGKNSLNGGAGNDTLVSSGVGTGDVLFGGNGNDSLVGKGQKASLSGGNGNDILESTGENILTGGVGKDIFYYKEGQATITDYTAGQDKIYYDTTAAGIGDIVAEVVGKDVVVTFSDEESGGDKITIKNGRNKKIAFLSMDDGSKIEYVKLTKIGDTQTLTGGTAATTDPLWFEDDDEFISSDNLSVITDSEVVGEFENYDSDELNKEENLVTYGG